MWRNNREGRFQEDFKVLTQMTKRKRGDKELRGQSKDSLITEDFLKENLEAGSKAKNIPKKKHSNVPRHKSYMVISRSRLLI